jgi:penicillin-binding protein A
MNQKTGWRNYQVTLKRRADRKRRLAAYAAFSVQVLVFLTVVCGVVKGAAAVRMFFQKNAERAEMSSAAVFPPNSLAGKKQVQTILNQKTFAQLSEKQFDTIANGKKYRVVTSIDPLLQAFVQQKIDSKTSRNVGIVILNPVTGKILSMVNWDKANPKYNLCAEGQFPAASIFKIITAAAAIETCNFDASKRLSFSGNKYTLYKSQLKEQNSRSANWITFSEAFAKSINPVFGKIGANLLKKDLLERYASEFGFNRPIAFELPLGQSEILVSNKPYELAEIASGFNRRTTISPIHGALIAGAVTNGGTLMEPFIIERIEDDAGRVIYTGRAHPVAQTISKEAAGILKEMMTGTITSGTCMKTFRGRQKDQVLSRLDIGGKTGSIDNAAHDARLDWFVGYAQEKSGENPIVVSVVVAHEKYIGVRASQYARMIFTQYFQNYFSTKQNVTQIQEHSFKAS